MRSTPMLAAAALAMTLGAASGAPIAEPPISNAHRGRKSTGRTVYTGRKPYVNPERQGVSRSLRGYQRPPEQIIVRSAKYAGERAGFRTFKATGQMRRDMLAIKRAQDAIVSAIKTEEPAFEPTPAQASAETIKKAVAPKKRVNKVLEARDASAEKKAAKPRASKKAAAE